MACQRKTLPELKTTIHSTAANLFPVYVVGSRAHGARHEFTLDFAAEAEALCSTSRIKNSAARGRGPLTVGYDHLYHSLSRLYHLLLIDDRP